MWLLLGSLLATSLIISLLLVPPIRSIALRIGFLDQPGPRKIHAEPMPYGGGIAVAVATLLPIGAGVVAAWLVARGTDLGLPEEIARHASGVLHRLRPLAVLVAGGLVVLTMGLVDDRRRLGPGLKFAVQFAAAVGFVIFGERLSLFWEDSTAGDVVGGAVTVVWIVGVTNAFNLLDHMDGLSGGVAAIASAAFAIVAIVTGQWFVAALCLTLLGACLGFLCWNFPPAKIFLGDAGSLFVGWMLATQTVTFTFYSRDTQPHAYALPVAILAVPLFDTASVLWIRLRRGAPLFQGDRNHFAHRLEALGMSRRTAVLTVYAVTLSTAMGAVLLLQVDRLGAVLIGVQLALSFGIITLLESTGRGEADRGGPRPPGPAA